MANEFVEDGGAGAMAETKCRLSESGLVAKQLFTADLTRSYFDTRDKIRITCDQSIRDLVFRVIDLAGSLHSPFRYSLRSSASYLSLSL